MATRPRPRFTTAFKKRVALEALARDRTVLEVAARHDVQSEPGEHMEAAGRQRVRRGLRLVPSVSPIGARGDDPDVHTRIGELTVEPDSFCAGSNAGPNRAPRHGKRP